MGLREIGPKIIVKTCGANGSEIYSNNDKIKVDAIVREKAGRPYPALEKFLSEPDFYQDS